MEKNENKEGKFEPGMMPGVLPGVIPVLSPKKPEPEETNSEEAEAEVGETEIEEAEPSVEETPVPEAEETTEETEPSTEETPVPEAEETAAEAETEAEEPEKEAAEANPQTEEPAQEPEEKGSEAPVPTAKKEKKQKPPKEHKSKTAAAMGKQRFEWWAYLPIIFAMGYVPLIVRAFKFPSPLLAEQIWFMAGGESVDFGLAYKSFFLIGCGAFAIFIFFASLYNMPFKKDRIYIPLAIYAGFVLLSGLISGSRIPAFTGSYNSFESVWVVLSYCALFLLAAHLISYDGMRAIKTILYGALPGVFIVLIIGLFQQFGMDLFRGPFGQSLIVGADLRESIGAISFNFPVGRIYTTLYNPDFVGVYYVIMAPIFGAMIFFCKKIWQKIVGGAGLALLLITIPGVDSATFEMALVFFIIVLPLVLCWRKIKSGIICTSIIAGIGVIALIVILNVPKLTEYFQYRLYFGMDFPDKIESIVTDQNGVEFKMTDGTVLHADLDPAVKEGIRSYVEETNRVQQEAYNQAVANAQANGGEIVMPEDLALPEAPTFTEPLVVFTNEKGESPVSKYSLDGTVHNYTLKGYKDFDGVTAQAETANGEALLAITTDEDDVWTFYYYPGDNSWYYYNPVGRLQPFPDKPVRSTLFPTRFFNARGGIWDHVVPKLGQYMLVGEGSGMFIMVYPQEDYLYDVYAYGDHLLDVKAHSTYMQQWSENGFIALVAYVVLLVWCLVRLFLLIKRGKLKDSTTQLSVGFFLAISAFGMSGLVNDSNLCSSPLFWMVLGMAVGMTKFVKQQEEAEK